MTEDVFSEKELDRLSREMDVRLAELATGGETAEAKWILRGHHPAPIPKKEARAVEETAAETGTTPESFWTRFKKATRADVCEEGGVLYTQWKKWGDLSNEKVLKQFGAILVAMGFSGNQVQVLTLSCAVIVVHLGVKAFCMEAEASGKDGAE